MKISLNELKKYVKIPSEISDDELIKRIGSRLVEVEGVSDWSEKYRGILIAKVVDCGKIPDTHLSLCRIYIGDDFNEKITSEVNIEDGLIQVVCGAPNVRAGMLVTWISPGLIVPETFGAENFRLGVKKLRGYESNGMLASLKELDLGSEHEGILEINPEDLGKNETDLVGRYFADIFDLNDKILEIENKSLTHRPDTFGIIGFARELAGIMDINFVEPEIADLNLAKDFFNNISDNDNEVKINLTVDKDLCSSYWAMALNLKNIQEKSGGLDLNDIFLFKAGMRPVSKLVDISNIVMLKTGQPLHLFDLDKLKSENGIVDIEVRSGKEGEELELIDQKMVKLSNEDIVIVNNNLPVALAGAMGGKSTEVDENTKRVLVESASFSLYSLRKTQMRHGIFSEAITRFTKGVSESNNVIGLKYFTELLGDSTDYNILGVENIFNNNSKIEIKFNVSEINSLLGKNFEEDEIARILKNVNIETKQISDGVLLAEIPHWRKDLKIKEDIAEEVGRLSGYDNISPVLPEVFMSGSSENKLLELKKRIRDALSYRLSGHELITYSFVNKRLEKVFQIEGDNYEIVNSISPDLQVFRKSLIPSLAEKIYENWRNGYDNFSLYEINQVSWKGLGLYDDNTPRVVERLGWVSFGDFYKVKSEVVTLFNHLNLDFEFTEISDNSYKSNNFIEAGRGMNIKINGKTVGVFGEIKRSILKKMKFKDTVSCFELDIEELFTKPKENHTIILSKFPKVRRDLTVKISEKLNYKKVIEEIKKDEQSDLEIRAELASTYKPEGDSLASYSFKITLVNHVRTMNNEEISDIMNRMVARLENIGAII